MKYSPALQKIGLSEQEAAIYETLLKEGQMGLSLLSRQTGIHRPALYRIIPKLVRKDLLIEVKKGRRVEYIAASPNKLEPLVENVRETLKMVVNNLNADYAREQIVPRIETYYGEEGIGRVFMDIVTTLGKGETYY